METKAFYTAITTNDLEKTLYFYVGMMGFHIAHRVEAPASQIVVLENDRGARLDVIETPDVPGGFHALRTNVDDLDVALEVFKAEGYEILDGPVELSTGRALLVEDPNGILIDIMEHVKKDK